MPVTLTVTAGPHLGQRFCFPGHDRFLVGRSRRAHFRLDPGRGKDLYVSRLHFLVEVNPPLCRLHDVGSRNGTFVNGRRAVSAELRHGDEVRAGHTTLRVTLDAAPTADPPPAADLFFEPTVAPGDAKAPSPALGDRCPACAAAKARPDDLVCPACRRAADGRPQPLPDYLMLRELGRGAMGVVHLAVSRVARGLVAVKTIIPAGVPNPATVERFLREADILRRLDHKYIVRFREVGSAGEHLFLAMDYVAGTDARRLVKSAGPLAVRPAVRLVGQLLQALAYAHARGFVHRDIKPGNLLLEELPDRKRVKVADFGLARVYQASQLSGLTLQDDVGGTAGFMAPEQITHFREVAPAADQYSAAATLYYLLTAKHIYDLPRGVPEQLAMILGHPPVAIEDRRADVPRGLARVIHKALAREPAKRFADVTALRRALLAYGR